MVKITANSDGERTWEAYKALGDLRSGYVMNMQ
jgi:hypothetical protein